MTPYEQSLYNQMKKLVSKANMRILRLERETGLKNSFGVKHLTDILSSEKLNVVTKTGRISTRKDLSIEQMKAVNTKLRSFMSPDSISTVKQVRKYKTELMKKAKIKEARFADGYEVANAEYQATKQARESIEHMDSNFWVISRLAKDEKWTEEEFTDRIKGYISIEYIDESNKEELSKLYDYAMGVK